MSISHSGSKQYKSTSGKLFGRKQTLHSILGRGTIANVLLWKDKRLSGGILVGVTIIWFLFEVLKYNLITLLSHISIATLLLGFFLTNLAYFFNWNLPKTPEMVISERKTMELARKLHVKLTYFLHVLFNISRGKDLKIFLLVVAFLWIVSIIGNWFTSSGNLLYFGFVCLQTMLSLYSRFKDEVDSIARSGSYDLEKLYKMFYKNVLKKIPRSRYAHK